MSIESAADWKGLIRAGRVARLTLDTLAKHVHPGVTLKIATHSWDAPLRQNQLMSLAAGIIPDTTYGEAYVNEFVQLHTYNAVSADAAALFPPGPLRGATLDGKVYGLPRGKQRVEACDDCGYDLLKT